MAGRPLQSHCKRGHPLTDSNVILQRDYHPDRKPGAKGALGGHKKTSPCLFW
jgi:hypothetical protein